MVSHLPGVDRTKMNSGGRMHDKWRKGMPEFLLFASILGALAVLPRYKEEQRRWVMRQQLRQNQSHGRLLF